MTDPLRIVLPKGRIQDRVTDLLAAIGLKLKASTARSYRPRASDPDVSVKLLKPRNIPQMLELGRHDCGFTGHDWVIDGHHDVVEVLDLGYDPVRVVAAVPQGTEVRRSGEPMVVATEYTGLAAKWLTDEGIPHLIIRTFGATEVFPPEDAEDMIVNNTATGETLRANRLDIIHTLLESSTRFVASQQAMADPDKRAKIETWATLMESVLAAKQKVLLEMNVPADALDGLVANLPCMRAPTVSKLFGEEGYAVKIAVERKQVPTLLMQLKAAGAQDILEYEVGKLMA